LLAIDGPTGEVIWRYQIVRHDLFGLLKTFKSWGSPMVGGPIVTAGGLIFIAATRDSTLVGTALTDSSLFHLKHRDRFTVSSARGVYVCTTVVRHIIFIFSERTAVMAESIERGD
jgi:hypothetical protein